MAKRNNQTTRPNGLTTTIDASDATTGDALEQRVLAFAEQFGRIAGTFQVKAEGWLNREALAKQIASVRDGASALLEQTHGRRDESPQESAGRRGAGNTKGRSGGVVDAPGKKHRKPMPPIPARSRRPARPPKCGRQRQWSRRIGAAAAAS